MSIKKINMCSWMSDCREKIKNKPLQKLLLPGTHHSGSYRVDEITKIEPHCLSNKWSIHQGSSIIEQLQLGIRFFDLHVVYTDELEFRVSHVYKGVTILEIIDQIQTFLTRYPDEFIVINVRQFINSQNQSWTFGEHEQFFKSCLVKLPLIATEKSKWTLEQLWSKSERVLLMYGSHDQLVDQILPLLSVYPLSVNGYTDMIDISPNTAVSEKVFQKISTSLNQSSWTNSFVKTQVLTTVDTKTVILGTILPCFYPNSTRVKARYFRGKLVEWCQENLFLLNIIVLDWVDDQDVSALVLLNCTHPTQVSI